MYATEFQTVINEPYIHIPNYEALRGHRVRIILLDEGDIKEENSTNESKINFIEYLATHPRKIKNLNFLTREEANER